MTRTVLVTVATQSQQVQAANPSAGLVINLINAATGAAAIAPQTVAPPTTPGSSYTATFTSVEAGTYTATAQSVDVDGNLVGTRFISSTYVVEDLPPVSPATQAYDVPVSISIS
ncbi:MAG TPA: hypothetical protein VNW52_10600, partial [Burkholderiaceae bacterium]|nr:hypothetical protein [Burkholderiaceae bacterium]